jgi:hypothetical protein
MWSVTLQTWLSYIASGVLDRKHRFIEVGQSLPSAEVVGVRGGSWSRRCFAKLYLAVKPSHVGADMDGLACWLHRPTVCSGQMRGQGIRTGTTPSHSVAVSDASFRGGGEAPETG